MKSYMNRLIRLTFLVLLPGVLLLVSSCKSTRSTMKQPLKEYDYDYLYAKMLENHFAFDYVNAKFSISYQEDKDKTDLKENSPPHLQKSQRKNSNSTNNSNKRNENSLLFLWLLTSHVVGEHDDDIF